MPNLVGTEVAHTRSRLAVATKHGSAEDQAAARREHVTAALAAHIARVIADAPPLTREQRDRLASLLRPTTGGGARG